MKKWLIILFLLAVFAFGAPVYSQDAPAAEQPAAAAPEEPAAAVPAADAAPATETAPEKKAPEQADSSTMDSVKSVIGLVLGFIGMALSALLTGLVVKLLKKVGIETSAETEKSIRKIVDSGIRRTEAWAAEEKKQKGKKPKSEAKLAWGIEKIDSMLTDFGIKKMAAKKIAELVEERLVAKNEKKAKSPYDNDMA